MRDKENSGEGIQDKDRKNEENLHIKKENLAQTSETTQKKYSVTDSITQNNKKILDLTTKDFFEILYSGKNIEGSLVIWERQTKKTKFFDWVNLENALNYVEELVENKCDAYFGVAIQNQEEAENEWKKRNPNKKGNPTTRGYSSTTNAIFGVWADLDYDENGHHAGKNLPSSYEEAYEFLTTLPLKPTLIVHTGGGIHCYLLLEKPWIFKTDEDRERVQKLSRRFQKYLKNEASKKGWSDIDTTSDLGRVLRIPNTFNFKTENVKKVTIEEYNENNRFSVEQIENLLPKEEERKEKKKSPLSQEEGEFPNSDFEKIKNNCQFIEHCVDNAANLPEPEWHSALSIAIFCINGEEIAHEISEPYKGYSYEETQRKIEYLKNFGPKKCVTIREQHGDYYCKGCKWFEKDTSPIATGFVGTPTSKIDAAPIEELKEIIENAIADYKENSNIGACLEKEIIDTLVQLEEHNAAEFERLKERIKKETKTPIRTLNKEIQKAKEKSKENSDSLDEFELEDMLPTLGETVSKVPSHFSDFRIPRGWRIFDHGVMKVHDKFDEPISSIPYFISTRFIEVDSPNEKFEITFYRDNQWKTVIMERDEALNNKKIERFSKVGFPVNSNNSKHVVQYLADFESANIDTLPIKKTTSVMGWHDGKLVTKHGILTDKGFINDPELVFHSSYDSMIDFKLIPPSDWENLTRKTIPLLFSINEKNVTLPIIGWFFASSIASYVREKTNSQFPILNCWGSRGAGKSTLVEILWRMMGVNNELLAISTNFVITKAMSETNSIAVVFDEYKPNEIQEAKLNALNQKLKLAYRASADTRGRADRTVEYFKLSSPICVIGEDFFSDAALRERSAVVTFKRNWIYENGERVKKYLDQLLENPLEEFAYGFYLYLMNHYLKHEHWLSEDLEYAKNLVSLIPNVPFRNRVNSQIIVVGIRILQRMAEHLGMELPIDHEAIVFSIEYSLQHVLEENETALDTVMKFFAEYGVKEIGLDDIYYDSEAKQLYITKSKFIEFIERHRQKTRSDLPTKRQLKNDLSEAENDVRSYIVSGTGMQKKINNKNGRRIVLNAVRLSSLTEIDPDTWLNFDYGKSAEHEIY